MAAALRVDEALELWRGQPFEDLGDDVPTLAIEAERLVELRLSGFEDRIEAKLATGDAADDPVATLEALVAEHPLRERLRRAQMLALYRSGRQAEALEAYQELRRRMGDELGIEPADETRRLEERILLHDPDLEVGERSVHNLPSRVSTFIGRVDDQRSVEKLLVDHRLVTIVGPGGAGKTRLAVETAERMIGGIPTASGWSTLRRSTTPTRWPAPLRRCWAFGTGPASISSMRSPTTSGLSGCSCSWTIANRCAVAVPRSFGDPLAAAPGLTC